VNVVPGEDLERARVSSSRAQQYGRDLPEVDRQLIGSWHAALQRDTRATGEILLELVRKYPDSKTAWFHSALNKQVDGDFAEAARCLERTIELDRSYSDAYNQLAYAYCAIGDFEKGIAAVRTYIALIPDAWNAYDSGAEVLMIAGRFDEAQKVLDEGFRRIPTWYGSCRHRAVIHLINGEPEGAREKLALYVRLDPSTLENVDYHRSVSFLLEGRVEKAIELLHRNVERARSENKPVAEMSGRMYLARVLIERGRHDDALRELQAIKLISRDVHREGLNPWPVRCEYYAGLCLIMRGNIEEAEARVSDIRLTVDSTLRDPFYHLYGNGLKAAILLARGDDAGASASLGRIPGILRANFPRFRTLRAQIAAQLGDRSTALQLYNQTRNRVNIQTAGTGGDFFDFWIEHSKIDYYLGKAHEQFGEQANAIQSYQRALHRWKDADTDYPPFVDAKERLARLAR
jgi:tetratricopeptide (TPR) repeat protein